MDEWINNMWFTHTMEYYSALKRKEILTHATAWKKLEDIMLSETNQSPKTNAIWFCIYDVLRESNSQSHKVKSCPTLCNPWTIACQAPLSMGLSRQEYWSGLPSFMGASWPRGRIWLSYLQHWQAGSLSLVPPGIPTEHKSRRRSPKREEEQGVIV